MAASAVPTTPARSTSVSRTDAATWVWRLRHAIVCALLTAVALNSDPGLQVADTKLDLVVNPVALLERGLHLWDPTGAAGQLQDQAYGYLFPMGPFFALGHAVGMPGWVVQRLWWGLVLAVGYLGFVALTRRLNLGSEWTRLVTGVGFALAPNVLANLGRSSVEVWPPALAAWVLVPLVGASAMERPRRAAALSGLAVLCMGGVNATVDLAALLPAVLWFLTRRWSGAWRRLALWWGLAVVAATLWWVVPLLALGRYSPPFLDYIEPASVTTSTTTLVESLRGTADWVSYLGDTSSRAGYALLIHPLLIVYTVLLGALGLGGLAWRRTNERAWMVLMLAVGLALVALGHIGPVDGFFAADFRAALDGALAPLRNIHKFDILIRLAVALGAASALEGLSRGRTVAETRFLQPVVAVAGVFVIVGATAPFFGLRVTNPGSFEGVPSYWAQASSWLEQHQGHGRTLLVPGSRFPQYVWGSTGDEPIQSLGQASWDIRNAVPLTEAAHIRWLDAVERQIADGNGGPDLADELHTAGVSYLLARNDLAYGWAGATRTSAVRAALSSTPGVRVVASFGPPTGGGNTPEQFVDGGLTVAVPALELYEVSGSPPPTVRLAPTSTVAAVTGGAEAVGLPGVDDLATTTVAPGGGPVPLAKGTTVLTDTPRRREANFGLGTRGISHTLTAQDPMRISKPTRDYGWSDAPGAEAVARWTGVNSVSASSSASDADAYPASDPAAMPFAAFDTSDRSVWRPNPIKGAQGAWLEVDIGRKVSLTGGTVRFDQRTGITGVEVITDRGSEVLAVRDDQLRLPGVTTTRLRLVITSVVGTPTTQRAAGVREVSIPHVDVGRTVVLPTSPWPSGPDRIVLSADPGQGSCIFLGSRPLCAPTQARTGEDAGGLDRSFTLPTALSGTVAMTARPLQNVQVTRAFEKALALGVRATASSVEMPDLAAGPLSAADGDLGTAWVASPRDPDPSLTLAWDRSRAVSSIQVLVDPYAALTRPTRVRITTARGEERTALIDGTGLARFAPLRTQKMTVHLTSGALATSLDAYDLEPSELGLGVSELRVPGVTPRITVDRPALARTVSLPCGQGPRLQVGGQQVDTRVTTTVGELLRSIPVAAEPCSVKHDGPVGVKLPAGRVQVQAGTPDRWDVESVVISRAGTTPPVGADLPTPVVRTWDDTHRTVSVGERSVPTLFVVNENANRGWRATLAGKTLATTEVDGWQQAYLLPAGRAGTVRLDFTPDAPVRWGMAFGALLVLGLLAMALLPERRRRGAIEPAGVGGRRAVAVVVAACVGLVAGGWGLVVLAAVAAVGAVAGRLLSRAAFAGACVVATVLSALAAGAVLVSGHYASSVYRADRPAAQLLVVGVLSVLALSVWAAARDRGEAQPRSTVGGTGELAGSAAAPGSGS